jgi:ABC-type transport system involved in multi-copper enzyme maturation permease subunit
MTRILRVEWLKLYATRATYGLLAVGVGLTALNALLRSSRAGHGHQPSLDSATGLSRTVTLTGFAILMAWVLGVMVASGEFRHDTATLTYLAFPRRGRVMLAKMAVAAVGGAVIGACSAAVATGISLAFVASRGYPVSLSAGTMLGHGGGATLAAALWAAIGVGLGSLLRAQVAGVIAAFAWALFMEAILGGVFDQISPYLPFTAATTIAGARLGGGGFGFTGGVSASPLPAVAATGLLVAVGAAMCLIATPALRRDIA